MAFDLRERTSSSPRKQPHLGKKISAWNEWVNTHTSRGDTNRAVRQFLEALDCPLAEKIRDLYDKKRHSTIVAYRVDPGLYGENDGESFRRDYLATKLLSKAQFLSIDVDCERVALDRYALNETLCRATNDRFINLNRNCPDFGAHARLLTRAQYWINKVIGSGPSLEEFVGLAAWGPGSTQDIKGLDTSAINKFDAERTATTALWTFIAPFFKWAYPHWSLGEILTSDVCKIITVPKNAKTDRTIGVEPGINVWFQKALGLWLRMRLRTQAGIDLNTGQSLHSSLAKSASINGLLATVDFSDASDLIARNVVELLLSTSNGAVKLYKLLQLCRTPLYELDGNVLQTHKFSSMGNGYTFELETLIFWAIAKATADLKSCSGTISVYGDDVILPTEVASDFLRASEWFGFKPNHSKSYSSGWFRESCGAHFFNGVDCKPLEMEGALLNGKEKIIFANQVRLAAHRFNYGVGCDKRFFTCWNGVVASIPEVLRLGAPVNAVIPHRADPRKIQTWIAANSKQPFLESLRDAHIFEHSVVEVNTEVGGSYTDGALIMNFDEAQPALARDFKLKGVCVTPLKWKRVWNSSPLRPYWYEVQQWKSVPCSLTPQGWEGWVVKCFSDTPSKVSSKSVGMYLTRLSNRSVDRAHGNDYELRRETKTRYNEFIVPRWNDLGPWF